MCVFKESLLLLCGEWMGGVTPTDRRLMKSAKKGHQWEPRQDEGI